MPYTVVLQTASSWPTKNTWRQDDDAGTLNVWGILSMLFILYHTNYHSSLICYIEPAKQLH